jgi:hypothetical protein
MPTAKPALALSAQQVDPLSWFTGPLVPIAFAGLSFVYGAILTTVTWAEASNPWLQLVAIALTTGAGVIIHVATRPMRQQLSWLVGAIALVPAVLGMLVSAIGYASPRFTVESWWAPGALSLAIASLAPYLPVRKLIVLGLGATVVATFLAALILRDCNQGWGPLGAGIIIGYQPALGVAATAVFSYSVVSTMLRMLESPSRIMMVGQQLRDDAAERVEHAVVARLSARAAPFLESIAEAGRITSSDRALAGQLARRLRDELVTQSNLTWLDSIASESRLVVVDPEHRARRMNNAQRTALRAMLKAIIDTPGIDSSSLMVELRSAPGGTTAVAVSLDMALPEGTRIMHLAPYYLTLKVAVEGLTIDRNRLLRLSFNVADRDSSD